MPNALPKILHNADVAVTLKVKISSDEQWKRRKKAPLFPPHISPPFETKSFHPKSKIKSEPNPFHGAGNFDVGGDMMMNSRPMTPWVEGEQFCDEAANETKADSSRGDDLDADDAMGKIISNLIFSFPICYIIFVFNFQLPYFELNFRPS